MINTFYSKPIGKITALLVLLVGSLVTANADEITTSTLSYHVTIDKNNSDVALVSSRFTPQSDTFYMFGGANQFDQRWAKFVSHLTVETLDGKPIATEQLADGSWKISGVFSEPLIMRYQVNLDHEQEQWNSGIDGAAYRREDGVFYTARALFVVNGDKHENIKIRFSVADDWIISSPWQHAANPAEFIVSDLDELATSMFFAGSHKEVVIKDGNFEVIFAMGNSVAAYQQEYTELAQGIFEYYVALFGGLPKSSDADTLKAVVIINSASNVDGEVIGNNISLLVDPDGDQMSQTIARFILVHEFFHLWNGKSFAPTESTEMEWFKEGFSNYYTLKALHHVGFLNDTDYLNTLEGFFYQRYISDSGVGQYPLTDGARKHNHWGLIYGGGMMAAMSLDMKIRHASNNEHNLDDAMRATYQNFYANAMYTLEDIKGLLEEQYGDNLNAFFADYITGSQVIPIRQYLIYAGIEATEPDGNVLGLTLKDNPDAKETAIRAGLMGKLY